MSEYRMVDVGDKPITARKAVATGEIVLSSDVMEQIRARNIPKGDVLALAEVAAILGVKSTSQILPLCHPLTIEGVKVTCEPDYEQLVVHVTCAVSTHGKTGVEMEALSGVSAALLCIYDLTKSLDRGAEIRGIRLLEKKGGKSRHFQAESAGKLEPSLKDLRVGVLIVSDRGSSGEYEDKTAPIARHFFLSRGAEVIRETIVPDDKQKIHDEITLWTERDRVDLIIVSGGTGVSPRDLTPEAMDALWTRRIPGIGELLRSSGALHTPYSWLSRSEAGFINETLVILFPGNPKAVEEGLCAVEQLVPHTIRIAHGGNHD